MHHQTTVHSWKWSFFNYNMVFGYRLHLELQLCLCVHVLCNHHEPTDLNRTFIFMGAWVLYVNSINLYGQMKLHNKSRFWDYELFVFLTQRVCFRKIQQGENQKIQITVFVSRLHILLRAAQDRSLYALLTVFIQLKIKFVSPLKKKQNRFFSAFELLFIKKKI